MNTGKAAKGETLVCGLRSQAPRKRKYFYAVLLLGPSLGLSMAFLVLWVACFWFFTGKGAEPTLEFLQPGCPSSVESLLWLDPLDFPWFED